MSGRGWLVPRADEPQALACPVRGCRWEVRVEDTRAAGFLYLSESEGSIRAHLDSHPVTDYLRTIGEIAHERDAALENLDVARRATRHAQSAWRERPGTRHIELVELDEHDRP